MVMWYSLIQREKRGDQTFCTSTALLYGFRHVASHRLVRFDQSNHPRNKPNHEISTRNPIQRNTAQLVP